MTAIEELVARIDDVLQDVSDAELRAMRVSRQQQDDTVEKIAVEMVGRLARATRLLLQAAAKAVGAEPRVGLDAAMKDASLALALLAALDLAWEEGRQG